MPPTISGDPSHDALRSDVHAVATCAYTPTILCYAGKPTFAAATRIAVVFQLRAVKLTAILAPKSLFRPPAIALPEEARPFELAELTNAGTRASDE